MNGRKGWRLPITITLVIASFSSLALCQPATCNAQYVFQYSKTWQVFPNGRDDTANLQCAFDHAVTVPGSTVLLAAGTYLTSQLVTYNFYGTFKGMGQQQTTVEALPNLPVNFPDVVNGLCQPNTTDCRWPDLIVFVDGDISITDMTIKVSAVPSTQPWQIFGSTWTALIDVVRVMGQHPTNAHVERVAMEGMPDNDATSASGFNVLNAMLYAGELPKSRTPFDYYFLSGTFSVSNSSFKSMFDGPAMDGFMRNSQITFGGSPAGANTFNNVPVPLWLCNIETSLVEISYNVGGGTYGGLLVVPWLPAFVPSGPSLFLIHNNDFQPAGPYASGITLQDDPNHQVISALISDNTIEAQDIGYDAIAAYYTNGTTVVNNKISGAGADGIGIWDGTYASVLGNDVTKFTLNSDSGLAQIVLDGSLQGLADTSNSTVICKTPEDTVLNLGTNNRVIGCRGISATTKGIIAPDPRPRQLPRRDLLGRGVRQP